MRRRVTLLVLPVTLVSATVLADAPQTKNLHPGTIVDAYTHKGLSANAYAYGSQTASSGPGCPTYPDLLDTQRSASATGTFTFHIDSGKSGYLAVYCEAGFAPRTETTNDNSTDGTRVQPDPITLFPTSPSAGIPVQIATVAISTDLRRLRSDFTYYEQSAPKAFADGTMKFSAKDRNVVKDLMSYGEPPNEENLRRQDWAGQRRIESSDMAFVAIATDLNSARSDFIYYAKADEKAYFGALSESFPKEKETIEAIRNRPQRWSGTQ